MSYLGKPPLKTPVLWQSVAFFFDNFNVTDQGWITSTDSTLHNPFFRTQRVQCTYQTSGLYGPTSRYIFYFLAVVSILFRNSSWVVTVALVTVMIYSSTAAIHAIVAAAAALKQLTTRLVAMRENYEVVLINGPSQTGRLEQASSGGPVWLPVLPMVYEPDADAVLAVVGFAYLCLLPMHVRSETLRNAKPAQSKIVLAWSILLFVGLIGAFLVDIFVTIWFFPQLGFCPPDQTDTLPMFSNGPPVGLKSWDKTDWYGWNRTVSDYFIYNNSSAVFLNACLYPCSQFSWPIRDPTDIIVHHPLSDQAPIGPEFVIALYVAACVIFGLFTAATLTVSLKRRVSDRFRTVRARTILNEFRQLWSSGDYSGLWILTVVTLAQWPSIITSLFFMGVKEHSLWWGGPQEETFRHIGQWGVLVDSVLLFFAGWLAGTKLESEQEQQQKLQKQQQELQEKQQELQKKQQELQKQQQGLQEQQQELEKQRQQLQEQRQELQEQPQEPQTQEQQPQV